MGYILPNAFQFERLHISKIPMNFKVEAISGSSKYQADYRTQHNKKQNYDFKEAFPECFGQYIDTKV